MCAVIGVYTLLGVEGTGEVRDRWLRRVHAGLWTLLFALGGYAVASAWEPLVAGLVRRPVPVSTDAAPSSFAPATTAGERAVSEARRYLDQGRPAEALSVLLAVKPEEPVYPFSLQLREQAQRALDRAGRVRH
jgi:hypothetical protein